MRLPQQAYWIIAAALFVTGWEIVHLILASFILPSPIEVSNVLIQLSWNGTFAPHILASLKRTTVGFFLGLVGGILVWLLLGMVSVLQKTVAPILEILRPIPPIAWIPLAILWFGIGDLAAFFIIFIAAFFPIFTNVFFGVKSLPLIYKRVSQNFKLSPIQYLQHVILPFNFPFLLTGIKTSIGWAWMCVIAAEMISANVGLGYFIEINRVLLKPEAVIASMLVIGVIGYFLHLIVLMIEKRFTAWKCSAYD